MVETQKVDATREKILRELKQRQGSREHNFSNRCGQIPDRNLKNWLRRALRPTGQDRPGQGPYRKTTRGNANYAGCWLRRTGGVKARSGQRIGQELGGAAKLTQGEGIAGDAGGTLIPSREP